MRGDCATGGAPGRTWRLFALAVLLCGAGGSAAPADTRRTISQVKAGVVGVGTFQRTRAPQFRFLGTGFAVGDGSAVATNAHVLPHTLAEGSEPEVLAVLLPGAGPAAARIVEVERGAVDAEHDLVLLRMTTGRLPALKLKEAEPAREGDELLFTGFPIGAVLGPIAATHRAMIAAVTPIAMPPATSAQLDSRLVRRLHEGSFPVYQLDATAYPGNSGSPLYEIDSGEVVGIVNMVFVKGYRESALTQPSGISYAIPVRHLRELLLRSR